MSARVIVPDAVNGIDVSSVQSNLDAVAVAKAGFEFAYVQSSRYSRTKNQSFDKLVGKLRDAGLSVGAYHFLTQAPGTDPRKQAEFFFRASGGLGTKSGELPPMVDWEFCTPSVYAHLPGGHVAHCTKYAEDFMAHVEGLWYPDNANRCVKRYPVLYSYPNYAGSHQPALGASRLGRYPLAYASYPNKERYVPASQSELPFHGIPKPWKSWQFCQYSGDKGALVPGVLGACDRQVFGGSRVMWQEFVSGMPADGYIHPHGGEELV